mmetsp:Transcript_51361/g.154324  ORF Transcript_51361/g.154324 Transcript_51361/m.154324 type:complete len:225 (-) Transcript_51361:288-962(-)
MKSATTLLTLCSPAAAFLSKSLSLNSQSALHALSPEEIAGVELNRFRAENLAGVIAPTGFFDPLNFSENADEATMKRYREAELTHGRVAMLATVGFLVGEKVEGSSFLFDAQIKGPAITHLAQVPTPFWLALALFIGVAEQKRASVGWIEPENAPVDKPGLLRENYIPGDIGFDPLGLMPDTEQEVMEMQTKELQNGRLAMIAAVGIMAQELVDGKGIVEHFQS